MAFTKLIYAGHSAVFVETPNHTIGIDPWLEANPLCPDSLKNPKRLDLIVLTHGHSDHAGDVVRLVKLTGAKIAATFELAMILIGEGVPSADVIAMNKGGSTSFQGTRITLTNAFHSSSYDTEKSGTVYAGEPCGVVLDDGRNPIYHAGDTCLFSDMSLIRDLYHPAIACLPIGDLFTMGPKEASAAASLVGCRLAIPIHYKTFGLLTGTAEEFKDACQEKRIETLALDPGESYSIE